MRYGDGAERVGTNEVRYRGRLFTVVPNIAMPSVNATTVTTWLAMDLVPLGIKQQVVGIGYFGVDMMKLPLKENGEITAKDVKNAVGNFFWVDDPEVEATCDEPDDESQVLPYVTILDGGEHKVYRAPMIMGYFLLDVATGLSLVNALPRKGRRPSPVEMIFFVEKGSHPVEGNHLLTLARMGQSLG